MSEIPQPSPAPQRSTLLERWLQLIVKFENPFTAEEVRLKCLQLLKDQLDQILSHPQYSTFLDGVIPRLLKYLETHDPAFTQETTRHQCRKLIIEIIHRLPPNQALRPHVRPIISSIFKTIEEDNEENAVNCLKVLIKLHKKFRPTLTPETLQFLRFIKTAFWELEGKMGKIFFQQKMALKVKDTTTGVKPLLDEIFAITPVQNVVNLSEKRRNLLPKASNSLKVLQELPVLVILMCQLYKESVQKEVAEYIQVIVNTMSLHSTEVQRTSLTFNKELHVEFISAQVKTLSFLAYISKLDPDLVLQHGDGLAAGFINLLKHCPPEVSCLRREFFVSARLIFTTELRYNFVPFLGKLLNDELIVGRGWTVNETLRPKAYGTLADLTHHLRQHLSLGELVRAVLFFSCRVLDESLPLWIQTMSVKLFINLMDSIRQKSEGSEEEGGGGTAVGREILWRMLSILTFKFKTVALVHLPHYQQKILGGISSKRASMSSDPGGLLERDRRKPKQFGFPVSPLDSFSLADSQALVKVLVCAVQALTWGITKIKQTPSSLSSSGDPGQNSNAANTPLAPREMDTYVELLRWGLKSLEIYGVTQQPPVSAHESTPQPSSNPLGVRSKEEKEVLDQFCSVFQNLNPYSFRELFTVCIDIFIETGGESPAVQLLARTLLANVNTSPIFASILLEALLARMEVMGGEDTELASLHLKLFRFVFSSVGHFPADNEQMLRPHLRAIVNQSMEHARSAQQPMNYFLLLRALFQSMGGAGNHDLLHQEFLPLLPDLLQGLNSLQAGLKQQEMKDLSVELCLIVPFRIPSLLPHLPLLMEPLVYALNGSSPPLVIQGLRTLELFVDRLQPEVLYEQIQPVCPELIQALWKIIRASPSHKGSTSKVAFRILGKLGGSSRKLLVEPPTLHYHDNKTTSLGQCLSLRFPSHRNPVQLPLEGVVSAAVNTLRQPNPSSTNSLFYRKQAWEFLKGFVLTSLGQEGDHLFKQNKLVLHGKMVAEGGGGGGSTPPMHPPGGDEKCRTILMKGITGWMMATTVKDIRKDVYLSLTQLMRHLAMIMTAQQQVGPYADKKIGPGQQGQMMMDPYVVIDALFSAIACEEKDLRRPVIFSLSVLLNCVIQIVHSKEKAFSLPMIDYITDKMCGLCYDRFWHSKMGGCEAIRFFLENAPPRWLLKHHVPLLKALLFVFIDLYGEVSGGSLDLAKANISRLITLACSCEELPEMKNQCLDNLALEFSKRLTSSTTQIREESMKGLELLAELQQKSVSSLMEPHRQLLLDMIPPRKHLILRQSLPVQLGLLEGNAFCLGLHPPLFSLDVNLPEHKAFLQELLSLGEADDSKLNKLPCYKSTPSLVLLKKAVMSVLACLTEVPQLRNKIISIFFRHLSSPSPEVQKHAFQSLRKFTENEPLPVAVQNAAISQILSKLKQLKTVNNPVLSQFRYLYQLFPDAVPEKAWEVLVRVFKSFLQIALLSFQRQPSRSGLHVLNLCASILDCFHLISNKSNNGGRHVPILCGLVMAAEKDLRLSRGSPLRKPLIKLLLKHPEEYLETFLSPPHIMKQEWVRFFIDFIQMPEEAKSLRQSLMNNPNRLVTWMNVASHPTVTIHSQGQLKNYQLKPEEQEDIQFLAVKTIVILNTFDEDWRGGGEVVAALKQLWSSPSYQHRCSSNFMTNTTNVEEEEEETTTPTLQEKLLSKLRIQRWKEPQMVVQLLLSHFQKNSEDYDTLFQLLLAFCGRPLLHYPFLRTFLAETLPKYSIQWKRMAFLEFRRVYNDPDPAVGEELKSKIIQFILIPCFGHCFEKNQAKELIGSHAAPDSIVSILVNDILPQKPDYPNLSDHLRIALYQLCCLLVEQAPSCIHGSSLNKLVPFAFPSLMSKSCVDPNVKYHGHLLLSHIAAKFNLSKLMLLQLFLGLLKAAPVHEAKAVVNQALDVITPAIPRKMENGMNTLVHWTRKLLSEEGSSITQLSHLVQLIVRHWRVYYPGRQGLVPQLIQAINRLSITPSSSLEQKTLAVDVAEVIVKWELELMRRSSEEVSSTGKSHPMIMIGTKNLSLDPQNVESVLTFLMTLACHHQATEPKSASAGQASQISKRCMALIKLVLRPDMWQSHLNNLQLNWMEKSIIGSLELEASPNQIDHQTHSNAVTALELLSYLIGLMSKESVLDNVKLLQKGIIAGMTCPNIEVIRVVHDLMSQLLSLFPSELLGGNTNPSPSSSSISTILPKYEELDPLYSTLNQVVQDGLSAYDKTPNPDLLFGAVMMLKAACAQYPSYIDRIIGDFMKCLQKLVKEHLTTSTNPNVNADHTSLTTELLTSCLHLVKNRVGVMGVEMRKKFIGPVLLSLIDKSVDGKVMETIVKMLEEWMKVKNPILVNQGPSLREKSILLLKMAQNLEKRFSGDEHVDLTGMFLDLVLFIYRDDQLLATELGWKLESAFLRGLRSTQPGIREKFYKVFEGSVKAHLYERLLYIVCGQNWEGMGVHYWIKQCEELLFGTVVNSKAELTPKETSHINSVSQGWLDKNEVFIKLEPGVTSDPPPQDHQHLEKDIDNLMACDGDDDGAVQEAVTRLEDAFIREGWAEPSLTFAANLKIILDKEAEFLNSVKAVNTLDLVKPMVQLCHLDTELAESVWISFFPRAWKILNEKQRLALANEMGPFLSSGAHLIQKQCSPSALNTFVEGMCQCVPAILLDPSVIYYVGKSHSLWHRMSLLLEQLAFDTCPAPSTQIKKGPVGTGSQVDAAPAPPSLKVLDALSLMYDQLREEDLWAGLWQKRAQGTDTAIGIGLEQQGLYEKAQVAYELAMSKGPFPQGEMKLLEEHWLKCAKELNQWDVIQEYSGSKEGNNPFMVLEAAWRNGSWDKVRAELGKDCKWEQAWKAQLIRGYMAVCSTENQNLNLVNSFVEEAETLCIREMKRLPPLVTSAHVGVLQAAQQVLELQEAAGIHQSLLLGNPPGGAVEEIKQVVKTWRSRLPSISDELSHWSDIFSWRTHHYQFIAGYFAEQYHVAASAERVIAIQNVVATTAGVEGQGGPTTTPGGSDQGSNQTMLAIHAAAQVQTLHKFTVHHHCQAICQFGKTARKHNLVGVALDALSKIYTIPNVPITDCFHKIRQQLKCHYIQQAPLQGGRNELREALEIVESTNLIHFSREMTAELFSLKALLLAKIGRSDDAEKAFSVSCQLDDKSGKSWGRWGDYLEECFIRDPKNMEVGISAITAFMQACYHHNEAKSRKFISKILWLLTYDDEEGSLSDVVDKLCLEVPAIQWLPWVPQLLSSLSRNNGGTMGINLLNQVGKMYPQAVYFPMRVLYMTLKVEQQMEKVRRAGSATPATPVGKETPPSSISSSEGTSPMKPGSEEDPPPSIKATPSMWRCSKVMQSLWKLHPTSLSSLEGIVDQLVYLRENWHEELLKQLKIGLGECYGSLFENRNVVMGAVVTPQLHSFVRKLVHTFGTHSQQVTSPGQESLRRQSMNNDPAFHQLKTQFTSDFNSPTPKLHSLIQKLRKWIQILEDKTPSFSRSLLDPERCKFLLSFNLLTADIELPGEYLIPKHSQYYVKIARFQPEMDAILKHHFPAKRIFIRGHNGKVYPYLVMNLSSAVGDGRREERVLQMGRMLNHYLGRQKGTAKRGMRFTLPKLVSVSPQTRLIQDNPASLSLLEVFQSYCKKKGTEGDCAVARYYDKLVTIQSKAKRGAQISHKVLQKILREIQATLVPKTILKEWAWTNFATASDYWMFRKIFTTQVCLSSFAEYAFHFTRLNPEMMNLHQDSGSVHISYFKFDFDGDGLDSHRPAVPFRLTPNISEFLTPHGVDGPLINGMIALGRCLIYPNYKLGAILRAVLKDEIVSYRKKNKQGDKGMMESGGQGLQESTTSDEVEREMVINMVNKAVTGILNRIGSLSKFEGTGSKASTLVSAASSIDNLCRMDPTWFPWL